MSENVDSIDDAELEKFQDVQKHEQTKKGKTFNQLDERFQWKLGMDDDHIFPEERAMILEIRNDTSTQYHQYIKDWSDKRILYFILSRRHDMKEVKELFRVHFEKASQLGFLDPNNYTFDKIRERFAEAKTNILIKNAVDKHDRLILYYRIRYDIAKKNNDMHKYRFMFWETFFKCDIEPIKYLRNGLVIIVDMKDFGLKNLDMSSEAKEFNKNMTGMFPRRIRAMMVVNGGTFLKMALAAGRLILSKKIMKRIIVLDKKSIKDMIPDKWLLTEYGGSLKLSFDESLKLIDQEEKKRLESL